MTQEIRSEVGMNKTGIMMSPIDSAEAREGAENYTHPSEGDATAIAENRILMMKESGSIGSIPIPMTPKGMLSSIKERLKTGAQPFLDKLGERIAFERTGVRLYEALISKYHGSMDKKALPPLAMIEQFHQEELLHYYMVTDIMTELGGDPTAMTPAADVAAVASQGWVSIITDPRTTFTQSLEIILQAELVDNAGWELLIELADSADLEDVVKSFTKALNEEEKHLQHVKEWVTELTLSGESMIQKKTRH